MKRVITSLTMAAALALGTGAAVTTPASAAAPAGAAAQVSSCGGDSNSHWYEGTYYSGADHSLWQDHAVPVYFSANIRSVINHTCMNFKGWQSGSGGSYCFWPSSSGGWPTLGAPFNNGYLNGAEAQAC